MPNLKQVNIEIYVGIKIIQKNRGDFKFPSVDIKS